MAWDPTKPAGSDKIRLSDDYIRANNDAIDAVIGEWLDAGTPITSTAAEVNILDGVTATTAEINILDGVTATAAEINILDGVTSTTAELNILDGVTATAAEINHLDGITASVSELNILDGVTATTAELNILDGVTGTAADINEAIAFITDFPKQKTINIGNWDMVATSSVTIAHGLTYSNIIGFRAYIIGDNGYEMFPIDMQKVDGGNSAGKIALSSTNIVLTRYASGFDNTSFNLTPFNRGYIIIDYID